MIISLFIHFILIVQQQTEEVNLIRQGLYDLQATHKNIKQQYVPSPIIQTRHKAQPYTTRTQAQNTKRKHAYLKFFSSFSFFFPRFR